MRIDLFLWYSRIFKSRTIASNSCKKGHVKLNDKSIKPSHEMYIGSVFTVKKNQILNKYKILDLITRLIFKLSTKPGRKIFILLVKSTTVDSIPILQFPPLIINFIFLFTYNWIIKI